MRHSILITGCSSGFGHATALALAAQGWHVFATVRKDVDGASLLHEAELQHCAENITPLLCDITKGEQVQRLYESVEELLGAELAEEQSHRIPALDALLNNAGTAYAGPIEMISIDDLRSQFELNVFAHVVVTQTFLPLLKNARGKVIFVSSISGKLSVPVTGLYSGSKFALEGICDAWRMELAPFGVSISMIEPASSPTHIWQTSLKRSLEHLGKEAKNSEYARLLKHAERMGMRSGESGFPIQKFVDVVERILTSKHPRARYGVPFSATFLMNLHRFVPDRIWDASVRALLHW